MRDVILYLKLNEIQTMQFNGRKMPLMRDMHAHMYYTLIIHVVHVHSIGINPSQISNAIYYTLIRLLYKI